MKKQILFIIMIALISVSPLNSLFAQNGKKNNDNRPPARQKLMQELNLSQDQKDQIAKLKLDHQKEMVDLKSEVEKNRIEMKNLFLGKDIDENKILDLSKKNSDIQAKMKTSSIQNWFKIYNLLNDDQKAIFRKNAPMMGERMKGKFMGRRPGMGRGMRNHPMNGDM
ncbi:MAG: Spy/CpxP family protein refolding chaperone [Ignavibacteriales bacterium]